MLTVAASPPSVERRDSVQGQQTETSRDPEERKKKTIEETQGKPTEFNQQYIARTLGELLLLFFRLLLMELLDALRESLSDSSLSSSSL